MSATAAKAAETVTPDIVAAHGLNEAEYARVVAALGHAFGPNDMRGVFRSENGGETWDHVLALSDTTGAVDL